MVSGGDQLIGIHHFRFSFYEVTGTNRDWRSFSAFSAFRLSRSSWKCTAFLDDLFALRLVGQPISWSGFILPRRRTSVEYLARLESKCTFRPAAYFEQCTLSLRFHSTFRSVEVLYEAQRTKTLATTGPYAYVRHPQYNGFILIMLGFLLQWPTLVTLIMFPILVTMYVRLARREEREVLSEFGDEYRRYANRTPAFCRGPDA